MRISDWSSDVCSSDLAASRSCRYSLLEALQVAGLLAVLARGGGARGGRTDRTQRRVFRAAEIESKGAALPVGAALRQVLQVGRLAGDRSEEHTSELQSLMRISYAVFCLKTKTPTGREERRT